MAKDKDKDKPKKDSLPKQVARDRAKIEGPGNRKVIQKIKDEKLHPDPKDPKK